jgi:hypothetical protein
MQASRMPHHRDRRYVSDREIQIGDDAPAMKFKSPAPAVVVASWCLQVARMDRLTLNRFTRDIWSRFEASDLEDLKAAILRRRRELACPMFP